MCISMSRRHLIAISAAAVTTPHLSWAQNTDAIRSLHGALDIDSFKGKKGARLKASQQAVFSIGGDAFLTNSALEADIEIAEDGLVQKLTILSGEALAVLKPRTSRQTALLLPNSTASIRGTGFYVNIGIEEPKNYICCCYGHIQFEENSDGTPQQLKNSYHNAVTIDETGRFGTPSMNFPFGHYDDELVMLEKQVGRAPHWQLPDNKMHFLSSKPLPL